MFIIPKKVFDVFCFFVRDLYYFILKRLCFLQLCKSKFLLFFSVSGFSSAHCVAESPVILPWDFGKRRHVNSFTHFFFSEISSLFFSKGLSAFLSPSCHLDKRTDNWLLVYSPVPISCVFLCYLITIWVGPKLMARRQPVNLRPVLIVYNFAMVCLSAYMFYEVNTILLEGTIGKDNGELEFRAAKRKSV